MSAQNGIASGVLMVLVGAFVVLRTVRRPPNGNNLVDVLLGNTNNSQVNAANTEQAQQLLTLPKLTPRPQRMPRAAVRHYAMRPGGDL